MKKMITLALLCTGLQSFGSTKCIAHRGYHNIAPDNSLEAIQAAQAVNADGIEIDIVHTADGVAILNHDKTFKKTGTDLKGQSCPKTKLISEMSLEEIRSKCTLKNGSKIPTLEEALELITAQDQMLFLELKDAPGEKTSKLVESFYASNIDALRVIAFKKKNFLTLKNVVKTKFWKKAKFLKLSVEPWPLTRKYGLNVSLIAYKARRKFFKRMKRELSVWTVNNEKSLQMLIDDKIDYITTDNLEACLALKQ